MSSANPTRRMTRVVLLVAILAQLLACHAVLAGSTVPAVADVAPVSAPSEWLGHDTTCEPAGTTPLAAGCRGSVTGLLRPVVADPTELALVLIMLLLAPAVIGWQRFGDHPHRRAGAGRHRLLALGIIRV